MYGSLYPEQTRRQIQRGRGMTSRSTNTREPPRPPVRKNWSFDGGVWMTTDMNGRAVAAAVTATVVSSRPPRASNLARASPRASPENDRRGITPSQ